MISYSIIIQRKFTSWLEMEFLNVALQFCVVFAISCSNIVGSIGQCASPQYLELNEVGIINCFLQEEPLRVLWYKSLQNTPDTLLIKFWDLVKDGRGYASGEYDIFLNGSLKINNVSSLHDGYFTVVKFTSLEYDPEQHSVLVVTTVKPSIRRPFINGCPIKLDTYCLQSINTSEVSCEVKEARPPIPLQWILRTPNGERNLSSVTTIKHHEVTSTTVATTNEVFYFTSVLSLLVCKAHTLPHMLDYEETSIIVENSNTNFSSLPAVEKFVERNSKFVLRCSKADIKLIVWKKSSKLEDNFDPILHAVVYDKTVSWTHNDGYELNSDGSLMVRHADVEHEGLYGCVYETDVAGGSSLFNVSVYVPGYPVVAGCNKYQYCLLEADEEGSITCSVTGIRPLVHVEVGTFAEDDASSISFTDRKIAVINDGDVYDVSITFKYRMQGTFRERITLECRISATNTDVLKSTTKFDLLFTIEEPAEQARKSGLLWILVLLIPLSLSVILITRCAIYRGRKMETSTKVPEIVRENEVVPMLSVSLPEQTIEEKRSIFLKQLKGKYADLYNAVQPIPYIRDRLFCVDRVFVEGGLEVLVSGNAAVGGRTWETLNSYHDILSNLRLTSSRKILEGEPGYGKSTLTLQFAYDWCNRTAKSPLKDVDTLILLRLRQLGGVTSLYRAIRQFILPRDSPLTETDIQNIISSTPSTMIILDGYDEYPDKDDMESDVNRIIARKMFQDLKVILTTRSSCLPRSYSAETNRVRLTGFDEKARDLYVKKAVVGNDSVAKNKILQGLKDNSLLADLCQVPLLFVMYAHMSHESKDTLCLNSVTSFFRHMIACFHSHMFNKMEDDNVNKYKLFEKEHEKLDNLAFEGLTGKNQKIVWPKDQIRKRIGEDFYDQYIRTGILIEEDVLDITYFSDSKENDLGYRKIEVRFYHKLFGEWYAAYTLVERCKSLPVWMLTKLLRHVDPFDLQYFYRFACGLSPKAAEKIIKHLKKTKGGDKFAILCILEKTGDMDTISDTIRGLCSQPIEIKEDDATLLQRSTIQLLEIASGNQISISRVHLRNCYSTVDLRGGNHLQLKSNLSIPVLTTLNELWIDTEYEGREITSEEFTGILQYSSKCLALKELWFYYCLLPSSVQAESVSVLRSRNVKVFWRALSFHEYQLNLQSCLWERIAYDINDTLHVVGVMTDDDYQNETSLLSIMTGMS